MDGIVNFKDINVPYTVKHVVQNSSPEKVLKEETKNQKYGEWTQATALTFEGYKHVGEIVNKKIGDDPITIYVYYEPDETQKATVTYTVENGTVTNESDAIVKANASGLTGSTAAAAAGYKFDGWYKGNEFITNELTLTPETAKPYLNKNGDLYAATTFTAKFEPKADLSYTVNYYWNGTTEKVAEPTTVYGQTFGAEGKASPATIDGCTITPESDKEKSITIGADSTKNVINFYYYKNVTLTANSDTKTYNGQEQSVSGFTGAPEGADFRVITVGASGTDVGTYDATFPDGTKGKVDATGKYIVTAANPGTLTISKREVTLTSASDEKVYDGTALTKPKVTVSGDGFVKGEVSDIEATGSVTNVSDSPVVNTITFKTGANFKASNYNIQKTEGTLTINKRPVTLTSEGGSKPYDGTALTKPVVTVSTGENEGFVDGEVSEIKATGSVTYVSEGEVTNAITFTLNDGKLESNYDITKNEGKLSITETTAEVVVTITGHNNTVTYNGSEQSITGYDVDINNKLYKESDFKFSGNAEAKGTNAGTYDMGLTDDQFTNISDNFANVMNRRLSFCVFGKWGR